MKNSLRKMSPIVKHFFGAQAQQEANATNFVQRSSKLTGSPFLTTFVCGLLAKATASLNDLTEFCETHCGLAVSVQGLDERIHPATVTVMQHLFRLALCVFQHAVRLPVPLLSQSSAVNISDSTGISLPESVADDYPGSGGAASTAGLKRHLVLEFLTGTFKTVLLTDGSPPDQTATCPLDLAEAGSLNLFDLGYFVLDHLQNLAAHGAYFLCRRLLRTHLSREDGQLVDLVAILRADPRRPYFELSLRLGATHRLPCRVGLFRVPEVMANRRRHNARKQAAKKGRTPSRRSLELLDWTMLITTVPASKLSREQMARRYGLRWQIELIFKLWKSHTQLHRISGIRKDRILVDWYAKLIGLVRFQFLAMPLRAREIDLSPTKALKRLVTLSGQLADALSSLRRLHTVLKRLQTRILKFAKREKRKTRLSTCQQLFREVCSHT